MTWGKLTADRVTVPSAGRLLDLLRALPSILSADQITRLAGSDSVPACCIAAPKTKPSAIGLGMARASYVLPILPAWPGRSNRGP